MPIHPWVANVRVYLRILVYLGKGEFKLPWRKAGLLKSSR